MRVANDLVFGEINLICITSTLFPVHLLYALEFFTVEFSERSGVRLLRSQTPSRKLKLSNYYDNFLY